MPYIHPELREDFKSTLDTLPHIDGCGELNYLITCIAIQYFKSNGAGYQAINDVQGALFCAAQEFTRRIVNSYEDGKIAANGDVYPTAK